MASFSDKLQEIKSLFSSNTKSHKSFAYSSLLQLQEQCSSDTRSIETLAQESQSVLSRITLDIADEDEEIAAQALKCLGFMIYHPVLVSAIPVEDANLIVRSLAELIVTTKMKSVCNLGVWCISIQQFGASFLATHFHCLLRAIIHALDNPIGSLSTTYEATQAVVKLVTELSEKMINTSNVWLPPIYRRLLSVDKRERDMSERCLLKIKSVVLPPPLILSKVLVVDMKQKLLPGMKELLNLDMKVPTVHAWGWFIRLLGSHAIKKRQLVNEMLKIPELTFSDPDTQVQIASLVAWEGLVDALIHSPLQGCENTALENGVQELGTSKRNNFEIKANGFLKSLKLIMTPLTGIMLSKCDISVHSSCLNTWRYLLHKLDISVNDPLVIETVLVPILETVFQTGPDSRSIWLWDLCVDLFDDFVSAKCRGVECESNYQVSSISASTSIKGLPIPGKCFWKHYPIKWLSWDLSQLDFHMKMICTLMNQGSKSAVLPENRILACEAALRIFRSVLRGVRIEMKSPSIDYNKILLCFNTILRFMKNISEDIGLADSATKELHYTSLQAVEAVIKELEPSILGSPLYKVAFDIKYIHRVPEFNAINYAEVLGIRSIGHMDMISPVVYLTNLYVYIAINATIHTPKMDFMQLGIQKYFEFLMSSYDPPENINATVVLLYEHMGFSCLNIWVSVVQCMENYIKNVKDLSQLKTEFDSTGSFAVCHLLSYPFVLLLSCLPKESKITKIRGSLPRELELEHVTEVWKSLYDCANSATQSECSTANIFSEDLCSMLGRCFDEHNSKLDCDTELDPSNKKQYLDLLSLCGDIMIYILEQSMTLQVNSEGTKNIDDCSMSSSGINSILGLTARFMRMPCTIIGTDAAISVSVTSRVFTALVRFVGRLQLKQDILSYTEIMSSPLLQWLSNVEKLDESTIHQLRLLWTNTLDCLRRSQPPIIFDSTFLKLQGPLLGKTLHHPNLAISDSTITFWNSTYGKQMELDYPESLCHVLDKLARSGRISLCKRTPSFLQKCTSRESAASQRYKVTATKNRSSKRVELVETTVSDLRDKDKPSPSLKRRRLELTEHQKEVRRAQQGREKDSNGHGPGVRTYTRVDFSQGNEESQDSQDFQNTESILEKLIRNY